MPECSSRFSTTVRLTLKVAGECIDVAQVGNGSMILRKPRTFNPQPAELEITISGVPETLPIILMRPEPGQSPLEIRYF